MKTVRFYVKGRFMGWEKLKLIKTHEYQHWIRSGNDIKIGDRLINNPDEVLPIVAQELAQ